MRALFLDGLFLPENPAPLFGGKGSIDIICEKIHALSKEQEFDRLIVLHRGTIENIPGGFKSVVLEDLRPYSILKTLYDEARKCDEVVVFDAGCPFFDTAYLKAMLERHSGFLADYTYTLGFPDGLAPQIVRKEILKQMMSLVEKDEDEQRDYLFYALAKDINSFDIETFLSPVDLRITRIKFGANDKGEELFTVKLFNQMGADASYEEIAAYIKENEQLLFTLPYMCTIELTDKQNLQSVYLPGGGDTGNFIEESVVEKVLSELGKLNRACKVVFGGLGEPLLHPGFFSLAGKVIAAGFDLIVETNGTLIDKSFISELEKIDYEKMTFVVSVDALREEVYRAIHEDGDFAKVQDGIALLDSSGIQFYKQMVRMEKNEEDIEVIIRNKENKNLILRKFSTYCGKLPDKKVVDLAPLEPVPCFHLRRELFLKSDGNYCYCKYSFDNTIGNAGSEDLGLILKKMEEAFVNNARGKLLSFCEACDEYYLFNF